MILGPLRFLTVLVALVSPNEELPPYTFKETKEELVERSHAIDSLLEQIQALQVDRKRDLVPNLEDLRIDVPSRARLIHELKPLESKPHEMTLQRLLDSFRQEIDSIAEMRTKIKNGEAIDAALVREDAEGSPVLKVLLELEEHRLFRYEGLLDHKRHQILANDATEAQAPVLPEDVATEPPTVVKGMPQPAIPNIPIPTKVEQESPDPLGAAENLFKIHHYTEALEAFESIDPRPIGLEAFIDYRIGRCYRALGRFEESMEALSRAASKYPNDTWGRAAKQLLTIVSVSQRLKRFHGSEKTPKRKEASQK